MLNASTARVPHWLNDSSWEWRDTDITEAQQELRRLIAEWNRSGPNLLKLFKENPELQASCTEGTTMLIPNRDGVAQLAWFPRAAGHKNASQKDAALSRFVAFLVNPLAPTLGGPCGRCGKFYVKNTKRQKTYCSRVCGTADTALTVTQKRRQAGYSRKLMIAQRAIEQWSTRVSPDVLEEMGNRAYQERDYTAVADPSSQFGETSRSRSSQARSVMTPIGLARERLHLQTGRSVLSGWILECLRANRRSK